MSAPPSPLRLRSRASFLHWTEVQLRYSDQDSVGHINNGVIPMCLEQARVETIFPVIAAHGGEALEIVLARVVIDYLKELHYPGTVDVGTRIVRVGTKSFATEHGMFMSGSEECSGTAESVIVFFDPIARISVAPPERVRAAVAAMIV